ncbi:hypothetical protein [Bradyrhizobium sp. LMTR 3]|uniref:hypothetical protein n=1 Tax=Bradyrhizobium sp. LMTR 3 TaxID=189873 RepID=UPI001146DCCD|nr:hypothetical protein [Bradyrhizobium sp. LMTR 3]
MTGSKGERQRNIDLVIKYVISEEDAKQRIAELKEERLRIEAELAALEEAPVPIALHPATLTATLRPSMRMPTRWQVTPAPRTTADLWSPISGRLSTASLST